MNNPRILAIALACGATGLGMYLLKSPNAPVQQIKEVTLVEALVLVAKKDMARGERVTVDDLEWRNWPKNSTEGLITKARNTNGMQQMVGRIINRSMDKGDPIRSKNLIKSDQGGVMAAMIPEGMRAISLAVESSSSDSGLILPNDRVDVILTEGRGNGKDDPVRSGTILQNIRVLAIGPEFEVKKGEKVLTGRKTASLELKPGHVEMITSAKRKGTLWLSLRSIKDVNNKKTVIEDEEMESAKGSVMITRYGQIEVMNNVEKR